MMKFYTYQFENNGDILGVNNECECVHIGHCDSDGVILLEDGYEDLAYSVDDCLSDAMQRCMPGFAMSGDLDWTPDQRYVKVMDWMDRYKWDSRRQAWIERVRHW